MMDNKTKAEHYRAMAEHCTALGFELAARTHRQTADALDPPQPEWEEGDYALDRKGNLWLRTGDLWYRFGDKRAYYTEGMVEDFGPIHKVHLADPAKGEVVVSIEGLDKNILRASLKLPSSGRRVGRRVADAAQAAGLLDEEA